MDAQDKRVAPLDLRAVEARLEKSLKEVYRLCQVGTRWEMHIPVDEESDSDVVLAAGLLDAKALLAHCRALRAALRDGLDYMHPMTCASMDGYEASGKPCDCWHARAAAVLAQAQDGPA